MTRNGDIRRRCHTCSIATRRPRPVGSSTCWASGIRFTVPGGGPIGHVELERDGAVLMLGMTGGRFGETSSITLVFVDDVDQACSRASQAGGVILDQARDQPWGLRQAVAADPEGQRWELSQHLQDVAPAEWGAEQLGPLPG